MGLDRTDVAVVVLTGGRARRLGGVDKTQIDVGGRRLLDRVLAAVPPGWRAVCVGPRAPTRRPVDWVRESPAGAGPVAAVRTAVDHLTAGLTVVLLAGDLPFLTADALGELVATVGAESGAVAVDDVGREQWLLSAWPIAQLRTATQSAADDASLHSVLGGVRHARVTLPLSEAPPWFDCDTPADLDLARRIHDAGRVG